MAVPFLNRVITPVELATFKGGIDTARAVISATTPVVNETEKEGFMGVGRERSEFLTQSYTVADQHPNLMAGDYNHANHLISNNLVANCDIMIEYAQALINELTIIRQVSGDQAVRAGKQVLNQSHQRSLTDVIFKPIYDALSLLFKKKMAHPPITPPPTPTP